MIALRDRATVVIPVQVLGELFAVLIRLGASRDKARETAPSLADG